MTRAARSLDTLLAQINRLAPNRSKASDGGLASGAHHKQNPDSDHEPDENGVYHARDVTHDLPDFDSYAFADRLLAAQDPRLKYVISNGRIGSGPAGPKPGVWRPYKGANKHDHHVHVSVVGGRAGDDTRAWAIGPNRPTANAQEDDEMSPDDRKFLAEEIAKARTEQKNDQRELLKVLQRIEAKLK